MNKALESGIAEELNAEASAILLKHLQVQVHEASQYANEVLPQFNTFVRHGGLPPAGVKPWVASMMYSAVMPDHSVCERTKHTHLRDHVMGMVAHTSPHAVCLDLRRAMIEHGCIYSYYHVDEDTDPAEYAAVTGYGLASLLQIDLLDFITEHWPSAVADS